MVNLYAVRIPDKIADQTYDALLDTVGRDKRCQILKYRFTADRIRTLIADVLIRFLISKDLELNIQKITFSKNYYGKPFLNSTPNYHFNVSHSGSWVICATDRSSVGIDVEQIQDIDLQIAKRFFTNNENTYINQGTKRERLKKFFDIWTLKESYIKAIGKGLSVPLDSFDIRFDEHLPTLVQQDKDVEKKEGRYFLHQYLLPESIDGKQYLVGVCAKHKSFPQKVNILNVNDLIRLILCSKMCYHSIKNVREELNNRWRSTNA